MEAVFKQYFWVVKALGLSVAAALAASALTTYLGTSYLYDEGEDEAVATGTDSDGDTDGDSDGDDEDDTKRAKSPFAAAAPTRGPTPAEREKVAQAILAFNLFCPTCTKSLD